MSDACRLLHERLTQLTQLTRLGIDFSPSDVPLNGVYVMFERGDPNTHWGYLASRARGLEAGLSPPEPGHSIFAALNYAALGTI